MKGEEAFQVENTKDTERSPHDICVLLLDSDETGLVNLSEMMQKCGYRVVATTSADDLPLIINNKDEKIDLVVAEFRFIEKNKYELLEKIRSICDIPVVVVGACEKDTTISECLCRGAIFCLEKPLMERDLKNLWQYKIRRQQDFLSQIDTNAPEKRKERADTDTGKNTEKGHGCDLGDQKKPKLIHADDSQNGALEAIPNIEEANNERKEPTGIKKIGEGSVKEKPELEEELDKRFTQPVTACAAFEEYEFDERDFQPLASVGHHEVPLSPQESSNKSVVGQLQMQKPQRALDEEVIQDGISLADLEFDLREGQGSTSDL